jgi:hypothetical protein
MAMGYNYRADMALGEVGLSKPPKVLNNNVFAI